MASQPPGNRHFVRQFPTSLPSPLSQLSRLFLASSPPLSRQGWGPRVQNQKKEALSLCKNCSLITKTLVWYQQWRSHKSKAQHHMGCCEESQPSQTQYNQFNAIQVSTLLMCKICDYCLDILGIFFTLWRRGRIIAYASVHVLGAINADKGDVTSQNKRDSLKDKINFIPMELLNSFKTRKWI